MVPSTMKWRFFIVVVKYTYIKEAHFIVSLPYYIMNKNKYQFFELYNSNEKTELPAIRVIKILSIIKLILFLNVFIF